MWIEFMLYRIVLMWIALVMSSELSFATEIHLSNKGSDDNPGTMAKPMSTIAAAYERANSGDTLVMRSGNFEVDILEISKSITLMSSSVLGWRRTNVQCHEVSNRNSWGIRIVGNASVVFSSFTMRSCGDSLITVTEASRLRIEGCALKSAFGQNGAAIRLLDSSRVSMTSSLVLDCVAVMAGSAAHLSGSSELSIINSTIFNNGQHMRSSDGSRVDTNRGGALYAEGHSSISLVFTELRNNTASLFGGALFLKGNARLSAEKSQCSNNGGRGALNEAFVREGGCLFVQNAVRVDMSSVLMSNNMALYDGGAVYMTGRSRFISSNVNFRKNSAAVTGGALCLSESSSILGRSIIFTGNNANVAGGALALSDRASVDITSSTWEMNLAFWGGALRSSSVVDVSLKKVSFQGNRASDKASSDWLLNEEAIFRLIEGVCMPQKHYISKTDVEKTRYQCPQ